MLSLWLSPITMSSMLKLLFIITTLMSIGMIVSQSASGLSFPGESDLVTSLPNYTGDYPKIGHYAGYLKADERTYLYYWFFQSRSDEWLTDPVVLWLNGGPGGSSLVGALAIIGPLFLHEGATLYRNQPQFDRSQKANLLFIETPFTVGFSYQHSPADNQTSDSQTAKHNLGAIKNFYEKFPHLKNNKFYLSGVSYASMFNVLLGVELVDSKLTNFKGIFMSCGFFNDDLSMSAQMQHAHTIGLIDQYQWTQLTDACCPKTFCSLRECSSHTKNYRRHCTNLLVKTDIDLTSRSLDFYNIHKKHGQDDASNQVRKYQWQNWFRNKTVMKELHISNYSKAWQYYDYNNFRNHKIDIPDVSQHVVHLLKSGIRLLMVNGDADLVTSYFNTKWLLDDLRAKQPMKLKWNGPWMYEGKLAGHRQQWLFTYHDLSSYDQTELTFVLLHGAGHKVDQERVGEVFQLFSEFISYERPKSMRLETLTNFLNLFKLYRQ